MCLKKKRIMLVDIGMSERKLHGMTALIEGEGTSRERK